jgi:molybdopterin converting factor small subunit
MRVTVRAFGAIQNGLGCERAEVELPAGATTQDLLEVLAQRYFHERQPEIWDSHNGKFRIPVVVMVSGIDIQDYSAPLENQQELYLVAPMVGG